jgi:hypothetical protein
MSDLASQIEELRAEFQGLADRHDWLCLFVPPWACENIPHAGGGVYAGEAVGPPWPQLGCPVIRMPADPSLHPVVHHANALTFRAHRLLLRAIKEGADILPEARQGIQTWEQQRLGDGWIYWLWWAACPSDRYRFDNYPQVAATALGALKDAVEEAAPAALPPVKTTARPRPGKRPRKVKKDLTIYGDGNGSYRVGDSRFYCVTAEEHAILQAFSFHTAMDSQKLRAESRIKDRDAARVLRGLREKYDGTFGKAIRPARKKGSGGYQAVVKFLDS